MLPAARRHDIDALRVLVFAVLILYHLGMLYVAEWDWHLKSSYQSEWLQYLMLASNRWRMPILFLLSGVAVHFLLARNAARAVLRERSLRLLLPLVFGMLVVVPIQPYCEALARGSVAPGFWTFYLRYWTFQPWPADAFTGAEPVGVTWNHLWYLAYLWTYTAVLLALRALLPKHWAGAGADVVRRLRGGWLLLLPALPKAVFLMLLVEAFPPTHALLDDWYQHALYFSFFLFGYVLGTDAVLWRELAALRVRSLTLACLSFAAFVLIARHLLPDAATVWMHAGIRLLSGFTTWFSMAAVLGWAHHLLNRPFRWLPYAREAVYPWYILHQSLIVFAASALVPLRLGFVAEALVVFAATVGGCALLHHFLIRRNRWLRPLFGLAPRPSGPPSAIPLSSSRSRTA